MHVQALREQAAEVRQVLADDVQLSRASQKGVQLHQLGSFCLSSPQLLPKSLQEPLECPQQLSPTQTGGELSCLLIDDQGGSQPMWAPQSPILHPLAHQQKICDLARSNGQMMSQKVWQRTDPHAQRKGRGGGGGGERTPYV